MRFKDLQDSDKSYIQTVHVNSDLKWDVRMKMIMDKYDISERTTRHWIAKLGFSKHTEKPSEDFNKAKVRTFNKNKERFIITYAQNETPVHSVFWKNIERYAKKINASIHVVAGRYKNPTSVFTNKQKRQESWDDLVKPYLDAARHKIHPKVSILSDVKIQPTANKPLTGFESITGSAVSCIIGHPKAHLRSLPVLEGHPNKLLLSTGACTLKNYTDSKAGKKGDFHHTYGFVIVELDGDMYHVRQVSANDDGSFHDLVYYVSDGKVRKNKRLQSVILGDIHHAELDHDTFEEKVKFYKKMNPTNLIFHDLFDGMSISHHDRNNPIKQYHKHMSGTNLLKQEVDGTLDWFRDMCDTFKNATKVVVRSNHDDFVDRWIVNQDWKKEIHNAKTYMDYANILLSNADSKGIIPDLIDKWDRPDVITLDRDDSFVSDGWELGSHGDVGANGSRGSIEQFRKQGPKMVIGHSHSPGRLCGVVQVGTSTHLRVDYNKGPSSWMNTDAIQHMDGKVQLINYIHGKFTTFKI